MHDLIVVGLGAYGAAVVHHAARLGLDVVGIDRFDPPHEFGSSHAETRVTRLAIGEGDHYVPFARRSHELWRELESTAGRQLLFDPGGLIVAPGGERVDDRWGDFVAETAEVAARAGLPFERLSPADARDRFPRHAFRDDEVVGFEPAGGVVLSEVAIAAQLAAARDAGAGIIVNTAVDGFAEVPGGIEVRAGDECWTAGHVVMCTGAWTPEFSDADRLRVTRQLVCWFEVDDIEAWRPNEVAFTIWAGETIEDYLGVFSIPPGGIPGLKVVGEQFADSTTPHDVDRTGSPEEVADLHERLVAPRLRGVSDRCITSSVCLYTNTPDDHFLIDTHPGHDGVTVVSACSGHGFKHSAAIGEALARRVAGLDHLDLEPFRRHHRPTF